MNDTTIVSISSSIAMTGLHITPDMWDFVNHTLPLSFIDSTQTIIHGTQPTDESYAAWAQHVYDRFDDWRTSDGNPFFGEYLMAIAGLHMTRQQIDTAIRSMSAVASTIYLQSTQENYSCKYPPIVPPKLADMRFARPWQIDRSFFYKILTIEPWLTYTERARGQLNRLRRLAADGMFGDTVRAHVEIYKSKLLPLDIKKVNRKLNTEMASARKALKRAVKLHERVIGLTDVQTFLRFEPLRIEGQRYDYVLTMHRGSLFEKTIIRTTRTVPCDFRIYDKKGTELASACLYFFDTSLLDYILHVRLHASNPETEYAMLRSMHITSATTAFYDDSLLPEMKGMTAPIDGPVITVENIGLHINETPFLSAHSALISALRPIAMAAFQDVVRFPIGYRIALGAFAKVNFWNFHDGNPVAIKLADMIMPDLLK